MVISISKAICRSVLVLGLLLHLTACSDSGDYDEGLKAYNAGDVQTAAHEWKLAAHAGDEKSQYRLAQLYEKGEGVVQNYVYAHAYYNLSSAQGNNEAKQARDKLGKYLTKEQLIQAQVVAQSLQDDQPAIQSASKSKQAATKAGGKANSLSVNDPASLFVAARHGHAETVEKLLVAGADPNVAGGKGLTALMMATLAGKTDTMQALLNYGADPNRKAVDGSTALQAAMIADNHEAVKLLISSGADIQTVDKNGTSPLLQAILNGQTEITIQLIEAGININTANKDGLTPLIAAIAGKKPQLVEPLLKRGANPNLARKDGITPLLAAATVEDVSTVKLLTKLGVKDNKKTKVGMTARMIGKQIGNQEIAKSVKGNSIARCNEHLAANRLTTGKGGNAFECFHNILKTDPENQQAIDGLDKILSKYVQWWHASLNPEPGKPLDLTANMKYQEAIKRVTKAAYYRPKKGIKAPTNCIKIEGDQHKNICPYKIMVLHTCIPAGQAEKDRPYRGLYTIIGAGHAISPTEPGQYTPDFMPCLIAGSTSSVYSCKTGVPEFENSAGTEYGCYLTDFYKMSIEPR